MVLGSSDQSTSDPLAFVTHSEFGHVGTARPQSRQPFIVSEHRESERRNE